MPRSTHATVTPWTDKETETALRLYASGHTFTDIAQTLRRTRGEIAGKIFRERRKGGVIGRLVKERLPPAAKDARIRPPRPKPKPQPQPIQLAVRRIKVSPDHRPHPPQYIVPPRAGPPTCWELGPSDCRFPIGRRDGNGPTTFCAKPAEPGTSWCPEHHAVVYTRRSA